jgi:predicted HTH transcriptional regulator
MTEKGCFIRIGSASEPMPQEMIESLFRKRLRNTIGQMESPHQDLTFEQLKIYYNTRGYHLNDQFLRNLELITQDNKLNFAAYLLADTNGVSIQVAKYATTTRMDLIENRDYGRCSLAKALKDILSRVDIENTIFTKIEFPLRKEREMIDSIAMREAVINAIVHNDYSYGASPKLEFFSDRVEITSMGGLPFGIEEEDFFSGCSVPRNKELMRVFRDLEIVEQLGSGIPRIVESYGREAFEIRKNSVRLTFYFKKPLAGIPDSGTTEQDNEQDTEQVTEQVKKLIMALGNGKEGTRTLMERLHLNHRPTMKYNYLQPALEAGYIEMTIPDKPNSRLQKYRITENGRKLLDSLRKKGTTEGTDQRNDKNSVKNLLNF